MSGLVVQGAKLPVDRRPSSPAPPVYQEEFESFFNCEGTDLSEASPGIAICCFVTMLCHCLHHWHGCTACLQGCICLHSFALRDVAD